MINPNLFLNSTLPHGHGQLEPALIAIPALVENLLRPNQLLVDEKMAFFRQGNAFPLLNVCFDGSKYWLLQDLELLLAIRQAQPTSVAVQVSQGDARQAAISLLKSIAPAISRREKYRQHVVNQLLNDPDWLAQLQPISPFPGDAATDLKRLHPLNTSAPLGQSSKLGIPI
jgi:hypothetical protein